MKRSYDRSIHARTLGTSRDEILEIMKESEQRVREILEQVDNRPPASPHFRRETGQAERSGTDTGRS